METTPTVFVVDADPISRSTVDDAARTMNLPCEQYASGQEFLDSLDPSRPGCVVLEMRLPDVSGFEVQQRLASLAPALTVVFVTGQATVPSAVRAMRAGALHVLEKPAREHELWDVLQAATRLNQQRRRIQGEQQESEQRIAVLTAKERQMMELIVAGESNRSMASQFDVCLRTVEIRRAKLMKKLDVESVTGLVRLALGAHNGHLQQAHGAPSY